MIEGGGVKSLNYSSTQTCFKEYTDYCCEEEAPDIIRRHILRNKILRADVDKYIENFPLKTYKYIYDLRLYDVLA